MTTRQDVQFAGHFDRWIGPLCGVWPDDHNGDGTAALTTAHDRLAAVLASSEDILLPQVADLLTEAAQRGHQPTQTRDSAETDVLDLLNRAERLADQARQEAIRNEPPLDERRADLQRLLEQAQASR